MPAVNVINPPFALAQHCLSDVVGGLLLSVAVVPWLLITAPCHPEGRGSAASLVGATAASQRVGMAA